MANTVLNNQKTCAKLKSSYQPPQPQFIPVVIKGKLAFKFDASRGLIEWQCRGEKHVIDLAQYSN